VFGHEEPIKLPHDDWEAPWWPEASIAESASKRTAPGVEVNIEGVNMRIYKDGKEWIRLKTPMAVRQLRAAATEEEKKASQT
jgi:hypothetical protein